VQQRSSELDNSGSFSGTRETCLLGSFSGTAHGLAQAPTGTLDTDSSFAGVKCPRCEAGRLLPSSAEVASHWILTSLYKHKGVYVD
jgi:hypothetical protein